MPGGRPTKLTPELQRKLCDAISAGNYYEAACGYAGVEYSTFRKWMRRGKKAKRGDFFQFFHAVRLAEASAEVSAVALWKSQMPENWQACRDFLARRHPKRWGPKEKIENEHTGKGGGAIEFIEIGQAAPADRDSDS